MKLPSASGRGIENYNEKKRVNMISTQSAEIAN